MLDEIDDEKMVLLKMEHISRMAELLRKDLAINAEMYMQERNLASLSVAQFHRITIDLILAYLAHLVLRSVISANISPVAYLDGLEEELTERQKSLNKETSSETDSDNT